MTDSREYITVGKLGRTRGVHGELYITPLTDFPDRFVDLEEIFVEDRGQSLKYRLRSSRIIAGRPVIGFVDITTPEDAVRLTNRHLAVLREQLVELPAGSYYIFELVGCNVYEAESNRLLGEITDVRQYPANDAYVIRRPSGEEVLFPAIRQYVHEVDVAGKKIVIESAGLFDDA